MWVTASLLVEIYYFSQQRLPFQSAIGLQICAVERKGSCLQVLGTTKLNSQRKARVAYKMHKQNLYEQNNPIVTWATTQNGYVACLFMNFNVVWLQFNQLPMYHLAVSLTRQNGHVHCQYWSRTRGAKSTGTTWRRRFRPAQKKLDKEGTSLLFRLLHWLLQCIVFKCQRLSSTLAPCTSKTIATAWTIVK